MPAAPPTHLAGSLGAGAPAPISPPPSSSWGYERGAESRFTVLRELGRGGNGVVTLVRDETNGQEYAMKSIPKVLDNPKFSDKCAGGDLLEGYSSGLGCGGRGAGPAQPSSFAWRGAQRRV